MRLGRRQALYILGGAGAALAGVKFGFARVARPGAPDEPLSKDATALIDRAWDGLDPSRVIDCHAHIVGLGTSGSGCWVNPRMTRWARHPILYSKFSIYRRAGGVEDDEHSDQQYVETLLRRIRSQRRHGRLLILAFDQVYDEAGRPNPDASEFFTPNDYVLKLAREHPDAFVACASIHPYRPDAVEELRRCVAEGAVAVKWLPNAHHIDPASPRCDAFYDAMVELGVPLISHAGEEQAVHAEEAQRLGNPLRFRRPLDRGVKVVLAHCASLGDGEDLDAVVQPAPRVENFDLFLRLMDTPAYAGRVFGDVSALTQYNRAGRPLAEILRREKLHGRLLNGSDYPLPEINALTRTGVLVEHGYLTERERELLNEIDQHNPLEFDFTLKRTLRWRGDGATTAFAPGVFMPPPDLFPRLSRG